MRPAALQCEVYGLVIASPCHVSGQFGDC
jgi:hypothetical protein